MKRGRFLGLVAASPIGFLVPKGGERNVLELTTGEFAARLTPLNYVDDSRAMGLLQITSHPYPDAVIEMFENNRVCTYCERSTYRYRWLERPDDGMMHPRPDPWYCVCGFEIGIKWELAIHGPKFRRAKTSADREEWKRGRHQGRISGAQQPWHSRIPD